eukprot:6366335-Prymnesium_polylepis.3
MSSTNAVYGMPVGAAPSPMTARWKMVTSPGETRTRVASTAPPPSSPDALRAATWLPGTTCAQTAGVGGAG